jgi:putative Holliday junction resolvase
MSTDGAPGRVLALDPGRKRIGIAVSDELRMTAQGLKTIAARPREEALEVLQGLVRDYNISEMVVGLPVNMDGTMGAGAVQAKEFAQQLRSTTGLPVYMVDERLTSAQAERSLLEGGLSRAKRKSLRDTVAATLILQGYLAGGAHGS